MGKHPTSPEPADEPRHPIRVVASRTGLSPHVIRVWELRYGAVEPARGSNGYRRYTDAEVQRLRALHELTDAGHGIGDVAGLDAARLARLLGRTRAVSGPATSLPPAAPAAGAVGGAGGGGDAEDELELTVMVARATLSRAVRKWNADRMASVLREAAFSLPLGVWLEDVLHPFLQSIGYEWEKGEINPGQEHMVSAVVPRVLAWIAERLPPPGEEAPLAVFATPSGTRHELGALIASLVAREEGWRTLYLGADLPAADIATGARDTKAELVALSVVFPPADAGIRRELAALRAALPARVPLVAGGAAAASYATGLPTGALSACGLDELRHHLRAGLSEDSSGSSPAASPSPAGSSRTPSS